MPVVVAAVAVFVERKVPTRTELVALLMLTAGVIVSVFEGKAGGNTFGITLSITGARPGQIKDKCIQELLVNLVHA